jgi:hypothetical protein
MKMTNNELIEEMNPEQTGEQPKESADINQEKK